MGHVNNAGADKRELLLALVDQVLNSVEAKLGGKGLGQAIEVVSNDRLQFRCERTYQPAYSMPSTARSHSLSSARWDQPP